MIMSHLSSLQVCYVYCICFSLPECFVVPASMSFAEVTDLANKSVKTRPPVLHIFCIVCVMHIYDVSLIHMHVIQCYFNYMK